MIHYSAIAAVLYAIFSAGYYVGKRSERRHSRVLIDHFNGLFGKHKQ
jgi:hypothetical protein